MKQPTRCSAQSSSEGEGQREGGEIIALAAGGGGFPEQHEDNERKPYAQNE